MLLFNSYIFRKPLRKVCPKHSTHCTSTYVLETVPATSSAANTIVPFGAAIVAAVLTWRKRCVVSFPKKNTLNGKIEEITERSCCRFVSKQLRRAQPTRACADEQRNERKRYMIYLDDVAGRKIKKKHLRTVTRRVLLLAETK